MSTTSAISAAYVSLGKSVLAEPLDLVSASATVQTLSDLLCCPNCGRRIGQNLNELEADKIGGPLCTDCQVPPEEADIFKALLESLEHLCQYVLSGFHDVIVEDSDSDDDSEVELSHRLRSNDDVLVVTTTISKAKFVRQLRKFCFFLTGHPVEEVMGSRDQQQVETVSVTAPAVPKAVIVTSPSVTNGIHHHSNGKKANSSSSSKKGCRCGNATNAPGKLTCGGQRCPCYVDAKACLDCRCRGCRNPHRANGQKVVRPHFTLKSITKTQHVSGQPLTSTTGNTTLYFTTTSNNKIPAALKRIHLT